VAADQLAGGLSRNYRDQDDSVLVLVNGEQDGNKADLTGEIFHGDTKIGTIKDVVFQDDEGKLIARHESLRLDPELWDQAPTVLFGFRSYYEGPDCRVDRIELSAEVVDDYAPLLLAAQL